MTTDKTGGPAFPIVKPSGYVGFEQGMTLWDWYAGHAIGGLFSDHNNVAAIQRIADANKLAADVVVVRMAAEAADNMLAERKKRGIA